MIREDQFLGTERLRTRLVACGLRLHSGICRAPVTSQQVLWLRVVWVQGPAQLLGCLIVPDLGICLCLEDLALVNLIQIQQYR